MIEIPKSTRIFGKGTLDFGGFNFAYTKGGIEISIESDIFRESDVDQISGDSLILRKSGKVVIKTTIPDTTLDKIATAWGITETPITDEGPGTQELSLKLGADLPTGKLTIYTHYLDNKEVKFVFDNVVAIPGGTIHVGKDAPAVLAITFESMGDDNDIHGKIIKNLA